MSDSDKFRVVFRIEGHPEGDFEIAEERRICDGIAAQRMQFDILKREIASANEAMNERLSRWRVVTKGAA